jgi:hypothetical protein
MAAYTSNTEKHLQKVDHSKSHWTDSYTIGDTVPCQVSINAKVAIKKLLVIKMILFLLKTSINIPMHRQSPLEIDHTYRY